jgi:CheY-like chemotaxis protein
VPAEPAPPSVQAPGGGETVLVVEDEDPVRELTRRLLARNGYQVLLAGDGHAALATAAAYQGRIDLLLTDVVMPNMLGKEVAERIQAVRADTRVLYMSGYAREVITAKGTLDPGVHLLSKPFSEPQLLRTIRDVLDTHA